MLFDPWIILLALRKYSVMQKMTYDDIAPIRSVPKQETSSAACRDVFIVQAKYKLYYFFAIYLDVLGICCTRKTRIYNDIVRLKIREEWVNKVNWSNSIVVGTLILNFYCPYYRDEFSKNLSTQELQEFCIWWYYFTLIIRKDISLKRVTKITDEALSSCFKTGIKLTLIISYCPH